MGFFSGLFSANTTKPAVWRKPVPAQKPKPSVFDVVSRPHYNTPVVDYYAPEFVVQDKHAYWASQAAYGSDPKYHNKLVAAGYKLDPEDYGPRYQA